MKKQDFLEEVRREIKAIKEHATLEEINLLDINYLNATSPEYCIYGQLTGSCESLRAKTLMQKGCVRVVNTTGSNLAFDIEGSTFQNIKKYINGLFKGKGWGGRSRNYSYLSALECYIMLKGAKNANIIAYLKGEKETLNL